MEYLNLFTKINKCITNYNTGTVAVVIRLKLIAQSICSKQACKNFKLMITFSL